MYKKIAFATVGLLIAVSPLIVSAQSLGGGANLPSVPANATITQLEALIAQLTQILQQLLQNKGSGTPIGHACPEYTFPACTNGTYIPGSTDANGCTIPGHYMCAISQSDSLTATDPNPVPYSIVAGGTTGVTVSNFILQPSGENMNLQQLGLYLRGFQASPADVTRAYVYQGSTLVGSLTFSGTTLSNNCPPANDSLGAPAGGCYFASTTVSSLVLQQNALTNFTIKADIAPVGIAAPATPGDHVVIGLSDAETVGANSGTIVHSGYAPDLVGVRMFKSYPIVAQIPLQNTIGINVGTPLIRFSVTAAQNGTIGTLYQTFNVSPSSATLSNVQLSAYTDPSFSNPIGQSKVGVIAPTLCQTGCSGISNTIVESTSPVEIPAGTTYYFQLSGVVSPVSEASQYSVTTTLLGDSVYDFPQTSVSDHFVWSPNDNGTSQLATNDWTNGDAVAGLPMSGLTQTLTSGTNTQPATVTYVSNSGGSVTASYANLPAGSQIIVVNQTSGQRVSGVSATANGSGTVTLSGLPVGTFFLRAFDASANYLAQSVSFTSSGTSQTVSFTAMPQSGTAPLSVGFNVTGAPGTDIGTTVRFGDGASGTLNPAPVCAGCNEAASVGHIYVSGGTYTATLVNSSGTILGTATIAVANAPANSTVIYVSNSGGSVTASYANVPAGSQIIVINQTSGQAVSGVSATANGSGTVTLNNLPAGTFYLKAIDAAGNYLAQSVSFTSAGSVTSPSTVTFSAWPNSGTAPLTTYFTISGAISASGYSVSFGDGSALGSNWQADTETAGVFDLSHTYTSPGTYTVTLNSSGSAFKTATVTVTSAGQNSGGFGNTSASVTPNANLANALTALESALQGLEQWLGK